MTATQAQQDSAAAVLTKLQAIPRPHSDRFIESDIDAAIQDMASISTTPDEWDEEAAGWAIETSEGTIYDVEQL